MCQVSSSSPTSVVHYGTASSSSSLLPQQPPTGQKRTLPSTTSVSEKRVVSPLRPEKRIKHNHQVSSSGVVVGVLTPRLDEDIFPGRGRGIYNGPGNKRFHEVVASCVAAYHATRVRAEKAQIRRGIIHQLMDREGRRFWDQSSSSGEFVAMSRIEIERKVSQNIRHQNRQPRTPCQGGDDRSGSYKTSNCDDEVVPVSSSSVHGRLSGLTTISTSEEDGELLPPVDATSVAADADASLPVSNKGDEEQVNIVATALVSQDDHHPSPVFLHEAATAPASSWSLCWTLEDYLLDPLLWYCDDDKNKSNPSATKDC